MALRLPVPSRCNWHRQSLKAPPGHNAVVAVLLVEPDESPEHELRPVAVVALDSVLRGSQEVDL